MILPRDSRDPVILGLQDGGTYGQIDDLTFTLNGNQVTKIEDAVNDPTYNGCFNFVDGSSASTEYEYDQNGNMTKDLNKNIWSIQYNLLNLPQTITYSTNKSATYTYDAEGNKLRVVYTNPGSTTEYCGNMIYEGGTLKQILVDGGYVTLSGSTPTYHYYLQDYLGNNRVVCNASGTVEQVNHYYPFGGLFGESTNGDTQRYKYNSKEFDRMHGLDWYDYGARHMDAMRFTTMDPLCEENPDVTPYHYCHNNPIARIDIGGLYDFEGINNWSNPVIAVFPAKELRDNVLQLDYQSAHDASVPIITVENIADFGAALSALTQKGIQFESMTINSHGSFDGFKIGSEEVNMLSDLSNLSEGLKDKTLFIGACNVGKNELLVNQIAEDTQSTVVAPLHKLPAGYQYDGSNNLNILGEIYIPTYSSAKYYVSNGNTSKIVSNISIDKDNGIKREGLMSPFKF